MAPTFSRVGASGNPGAVHLAKEIHCEWCLDERQILLTESDVEEWRGWVGLPNSGLYDALAFRLALGFNSNTLDFGFSDQVVNELHGIITFRNEDRPELFWSIFLAFDAGEYYHDGNRSIDPVEAYTRPQIAQIVQRHAPGR
jgi:hypothetical protein